MIFKSAKVGTVGIGGNFPISVQSMLKNKINTCSQKDLLYLYNAGCDIMRFSIISETENEVRNFVKKAPFPIVADIQGNTNQAIMAILAGCAGIRINPGNFREADLEKLLDTSRNFCLRIGINEASLGGKNALKEVEKHLNFFTSRNFENIVVSIKSSNIERTLQLNEEYAKRFEYPLHIGLTEAGGLASSSVKSTFVLSSLLKKGIGSTIRYSISSPEIDEIICGCELLRTLGLKNSGLNITSCPMCSRHGVDTNLLSKAFQDYIFTHFNTRNLSLNLAVMGCVVNGRGEAAGADVAICALHSGQVEIYKKGELVGKFPQNDAFEVVKNIIDKDYIKKV